MLSSDTTEVSEHRTIAELVALYTEAETAIRAGFASVHGAIQTLNRAFALGDHGVYLREKHARSAVNCRWDEPEVVIDELRRSVWAILIDRMNVRKAMSIKAWDDLSKQIDEGEAPAITAENIEGLLRKFQHDVPEMVKAAVDEVFDFLRPRRSEYKTNTEFEIGERVVLSGFVEPDFGRRWRVCYYREQYLIALQNVFDMVDGRVGLRPDGKTYYSELSEAIKACPMSEPCRGETPLFEFRGYKNRNLHLRFKRMDLVKKLNAIAGGARLKPMEVSL